MEHEQDRTSELLIEPRTAEAIAAQLTHQFGFVMTAPEVVGALKLHSVDALRMARRRGQIALDPIPVDGRRSLVFATDAVAEVLADWLRRAPAKELAM